MNTQRFLRFSGLVLVIGAVVSLVAQVGNAFFYGDSTSYANQPLYITDNLVLAAGAIALLFGLPGVYASRAEGFGVVGLVGTAMIFSVGCFLGVFFSIVSVVVAPWLATQAPSLANGSPPPGFIPVFIGGQIFVVVGSILIAIPMLRGRVSPRWPAFVLLLAAVAAIVGFLANNGPGNSLVSSFLGTLSPMILFVALAGLGFSTWSHPTPPTTDPSPPTTAEVAAQP